MDRTPVASSQFPDLTQIKNLFIHQRRELAEFFGFETRNKYEVVDGQGKVIAFAAEQGKGILGLLIRGYLGHWRRFEIRFFNSQREVVLIAKHPFRFFFQRLEIYNPQEQLLGSIQQRFAVFSKKFDVEGERGQLIFEIKSPFWSFWTFNFRRRGAVVASVKKKWSGGLTELFTDRDNFLVEYQDVQLTQNERILTLAAGMFIDLQYFERKAR